MNENLTWTKIFSGKFVFTVVTAVVFLYGAYSKHLSDEQVFSVIMLVVGFYFAKTENQGASNEKDTPVVPAVPVKPAEPLQS